MIKGLLLSSGKGMVGKGMSRQEINGTIVYIPVLHPGHSVTG